MKMMKSIYIKFAKRTFIFILLVHFAVLNFAATYYLSNAGNDANSGISEALAWQTMSKVNAASFVAGDNILFKRGDTFYGSITVKNSGTAGNPITFGAYGTGKNPVITGFTSVTAWTNLGSNIWESTNAVSTLTTCNMVTINGVNTAMGRFPNADTVNGGYLTYETYSTNVSITSSSLSGTPNWTGAEVVIRKERYIIDRNPITSQSVSTITYSGGGVYTGKANFGFFIQNDIRTLDQQNEWYYNPTTKKISIYSATQPTNVKVASVETLVKILYKNYLLYENISFEGANTEAFYLGSSSNLSFSNVDISYSYNGIYSRNWGSSSDNFVLQNSKINDVNSDAVNLSSEFTNAILIGNTISNCGILRGMSTASNGNGLLISGKKSQIQSNYITNCGYCGISFGGDSTTVSNNFVNYSCLLKDDGAGIYTGQHSGQIINKNIVLNTVGNYEGTGTTTLSPIGIYSDDNTSHSQITNNSVYRSGRIGIYLHNSDYITVQNNTVFDCNEAFTIYNDDANVTITHLSIDNNIFVAKSTSQYIYITSSVHNNLTRYGTFYQNYYARPIDDTKIIRYWISGLISEKSLDEWQSFSGLDVHSNKSPQAITNEADLRFEYNSTITPKTVALSVPMIDMKGAKYATSVTLKPFTSVVLMKDAKPVQVVVPVYVGSSIENDTPTLLEMTYSTNLANILPATSAFSVKVNSIKRIVNSVSISGTKVILTLESPLFYGDIVTVDYAKPSVNPIQTSSEGQAVSLNSQSVLNNVAILKQGSVLPTHFVPVWKGENGLNHMNIMVVSAIHEDFPLSPEDEIAVFSGSKCVGSMKLSKIISADDNSTFLTIPASQDDGSNNGFTLNDTIVFKIWDNKNQQEMIAKAVVYRSNIPTWLTNGKYVAGATSVVEIVSYTEYSQMIALKKGYNMISTYVSAQNPLVCHLTQTLADAGYLIKLQDETGNSLENWGSFGGWVNNVGEMQKTEGYKIKVSDNCSLEITGRPIALPLDIPLKTGWNIISFPRTDMVDAMNIIQPLIDQNKLLKVQDEAGNSIENWGIFGGWKNGIGYFTPGKAYKVKMTADALLTIQENYLKSVSILANLEEPTYFSTKVEGNGSDHFNINVVGLREAGISAGDELAAYDGNLCVGVLKITENNIIEGSAALVASVSSNDRINDGFTEGHAIELIAWNKLTGDESKVEANVISGQMNYIKNSSVLLKVKTLTTGVSSFNEISTIEVFPNPSQGKVTVRFSSIPDAGSRIDILDISGRKVATRVITGTEEEFQLGNQPAGVYFVKTMFGGSKETINKLVLN